MWSSVEADAWTFAAMAEKFPKCSALRKISPNKVVDCLCGNPKERVAHNDLVGAQAEFELLDNEKSKRAFNLSSGERAFLKSIVLGLLGIVRRAFSWSLELSTNGGVGATNLCRNISTGIIGFVEPENSSTFVKL